MAEPDNLRRLEQAERDLREARERLDLTLAVANLGHWRFDPASGRYTEYDKHRHLFGLEDADGDLRFEDTLGRVHPDDKEIPRTALKLAVSEGRDVDVTFRTVHPDGEIRWLHTIGRIRRDHAGRTESIYGVTQDVTAHKRTEETLRQDEEIFRSLFRQLPNPASLQSMDGTLLEFSDVFQEATGYAREELLGRTTVELELWKNVEQRRAAMARLATTGRIDGVEFEFSPVRGPVRTMTFSARRIELRGEPAILAAAHDITDRKSADDALRKMSERMGQMQKLEALGVLVAGVAHNMNNVLAAIMGTASWRERIAADPADREAFKIIDTACKRGRDVVKSLMQFSKPTLPSRAPVEIHALASEARILLKDTKPKDIEVVEVFENRELWTEGDAGTLSSVLVNLCLNAFDAMPHGGSLRLRTRSTPDAIEVSVEDSGEGMPPEVLSRALEPFFTTKPLGSGTGLGLSMSHGVVKAHGGSLEIESVVGGGTTVRIRLPRIGAPKPEPSRHQARIANSCLKVLLVDDDEDVLFLTERILAHAGHRVTTANSGLRALEVFGKDPGFDLVVLDQNMPGLSGAQVVERIRATDARIPILVSTGQPDAHEWECFKTPRVSVISKPFGIDEIVARLAGLLQE